MLDDGGGSSIEDRMMLMERYLAVFGASSIKILLADREFRPGRKGEYAAEILDGFNGTIQVDAYGGYSHLATSDRISGDPLKLAFCRVGGVVTEPRPSQIRTCRIPASGSSRSSFAQGRLH